MKYISIVPLAALLIIGAGCSTQTPPPASSTQTKEQCQNTPEKTGCEKYNTTAQNHKTYTIHPADTNASYTPNTPATYTYSIIDERGNTLKNFATVHEKIMHFIIIRKDLQTFQHLHPEYNPNTGVFTLLDLNFPSDGQYRLFTDFAPADGQKDMHGDPSMITLHQDITVGSKTTYKPMPIGEARTKTFDGYQITLRPHHEPVTANSNSTIIFEIRKNGKLVTTLEEYLGARGHSVILRENDLQFIHAHPSEHTTEPQTGNVRFAVFFPEPGKYKLFTQFQLDGKILTTDFGVSVTPGTSPSSDEAMDHSM